MDKEFISRLKDKEFVISKLKNRYTIAIGVIVLLLLVIIILIAIPKETVDLPIDEEEYTIPIPSDTEMVEGIVKNNDKSDIEVISNKNNDQSDLILDAINVDIKDLYTYAGSIDSRLESAHAIVILRPKEEEYNKVHRNLVFYIAEKQEYLENAGLDDTTLYDIAKRATIYDYNEYIILVMEDNEREILLSIIEQLEQAKLINNTTEISEDGLGEIVE